MKTSFVTRQPSEQKPT